MKTFKFFFSFLILALLFTASVSAEGLLFSDNSTFDSLEQNQNLPLVSHYKLFSFIDTESESLVSSDQPDTLPLSFEDIKTKSEGFSEKSFELFIVQCCKFQIYALEYFNKFSTKQIIFPFHSFW